MPGGLGIAFIIHSYLLFYEEVSSLHTVLSDMNKSLNRSSQPIHGTLTGTASSGPWSNGNKGVLHTPQSSKAGISLSDAV